MKIPRDIATQKFVHLLKKEFGYEVTRQVGSHMRLSTEVNGQHHLTIPAHKTITIGKLNMVLWELVHHFQIPREVLLEKLFS